VHIIALVPAVTEPPKIILYYRLSWSTWPLSNNKELWSRFRRVTPDKSHTTGSLICAKPTRRRDQSTTLHYIKGSQVQHYYKPGFSYIKVNIVQSLNSRNKSSGRYTWEAIHRVSLINIVLPLKLPTIWDRARPDGVTWKPQIKQGWVLILSKTYPTKIKYS
jgi:hypothetical protein